MILKFAFSKSGVAIRWLVGLFIGWIASKIGNTISKEDFDAIQTALVGGATAIVALGYAAIQFWLNARQQQGVKVIQELVGAEKDGVVGNHTITSVAVATDTGPHELNKAIAYVRNGDDHA